MATLKSDYPVVINGKTYLLRFKYLAREIIESLAGDIKGNHVAVKVVLFAGLRKHHAEVTLEDCAEMLDDAEDFDRVVKDIMGAFAEATGTDAKKKTEPEADPARA